LSLGMMLWVLWVKLFTSAALPGWASSVIPIYFLGRDSAPEHRCTGGVRGQAVR
jgi:hypothetical protein